MEHWVELRDECDRLFGRLELTSGRLECKNNGRMAWFDLPATLRERRSVVVRMKDLTQAQPANVQASTA